jgi:hypothetical protein
MDDLSRTTALQFSISAHQPPLTSTRSATMALRMSVKPQASLNKAHKVQAAKPQKVRRGVRAAGG